MIHTGRTEIIHNRGFAAFKAQSRGHRARLCLAGELRPLQTVAQAQRNAAQKGGLRVGHRAFEQQQDAVSQLE